MASSDQSIKDIAAGLDGVIFADSSLKTDEQNAEIKVVDDLRSAALSLDASQAAADAKELADSKLQAMARATEIPSLNAAAKALTGITALVTGLFVGIGFTTGDFVRMIRDFWLAGFFFLLLASFAILAGTFAVAINAYRSSKHLWAERIALSFGIACATAAFIIAGWGLSQGASVGQTRPTISASFDTSSNAPVLKVSANSSDVPRSEHLTVTVWGKGANGWTVLGDVVNGPAPDGTATASLTVNNVTSYNKIVASALVSSAEGSIPQHFPPSKCSDGKSCVRLLGLATPSSTPAPTPGAASSPAVTPTPGAGSSGSP